MWFSSDTAITSQLDRFFETYVSLPTVSLCVCFSAPSSRIYVGVTVLPSNLDVHLWCNQKWQGPLVWTESA